VPANDLSEVGRAAGPCRSPGLRRRAHSARSVGEKGQRLRDDARGLAHGLREMEVARRGAEAPMPEQALKRVHIDPRMEQMGGERVSVMPISA
jgi:hypothetical protein